MRRLATVLMLVTLATSAQAGMQDNLVKEYNVTSLNCRGDLTGESDAESCNRAITLHEQLQKVGYCFDTKGKSDGQSHWHKCR